MGMLRRFLFLCITNRSFRGGDKILSVRAYVLIDVAGDSVENVVEELSDIEGIKFVGPAEGRLRDLTTLMESFDIMAHIQADDSNDLGEAITSRVRSIAGVTKTITCIAIEYRILGDGSVPVA